MYDLNSEGKQVERAQAGDKEAFASLYDGLFPGVYGFARSRLATDQLAEDVTSKTFLAVLHQLDRFEWRGPGSFRAWVFRILRNQIANFYRKNGHQKELDLDELTLQEADSSSPDPERLVRREEQKETLAVALAALSPRQREIVQLRYIGGLYNKEIALMLGLQERTVSGYLSRAMESLRGKLGLVEVLNHEV